MIFFNFIDVNLLRKHLGSFDATPHLEIINYTLKNRIKKMCDSSAVPKWEDIDAAGTKYPPDIAEYANDIFNHLKSVEKILRPKSDYLDKQSDLNSKMRRVVVDWMVEVQVRLGLRKDTLFLAVNMLDCFLSKASCSRKDLQLIAVVALMMAAKFDEIYWPNIEEYVFISANTYSKKKLLAAERIIWTKLNYQLCRPTAFNFLSRYCDALLFSEKKLLHLTQYIAYLSLIEYDLLKYLPSEIAAASAYLAAQYLGKENPWNATFEHYTQFTEPELVDCIAALKLCISKYGNLNNPYSSIFKYFKRSRNSHVSNILNVHPENLISESQE